MTNKKYIEGSVLIVDDEISMRELVRQYLEESVPHIFEASNGKEALTWLESNDVDVVLTDIRMPEMDGISMVERIAKMQLDTVAIVMTGYEETSAVKRALVAGVHDFINKPFNGAFLVSLVNNAVETSQWRRYQGELIVLILKEYGREVSESYSSLTTKQKIKCASQICALLKMRQLKAS